MGTSNSKSLEHVPPTREQTRKNEHENIVYYADKIFLEADTEFPKLNFEGHNQTPYEFLPIPYDEDGYTIAFPLHKEKEILEFFKKFGFVVIENVLSEEDCQKTRDELWEHIEDHHPGVDRNKPWTWTTESWPRHADIGIIGDYPVLSPQFCENRQNPLVHQAFSIALETKRLRVGIDRCGMMRPTVDVPNEDGTVSDRPEWKSHPFLHLDMYPWTGKVTTFGYYAPDIRNINSFKQLIVQGMVAIKDCGPNDGGFCLIAGFPNHIKHWAIENESKYYDSWHQTSTLLFPETDPLWKDIQNINLRRGSLCIFNNQTPHGTRPNNSSSGRMIQYMKMIDADYPEFQSYVPREQLPIKLTELGEKVYGFKPYK